MIKARHHPFYVWFFNRYSDWMLHYHFHKVCISGDAANEDMALLLVGNHFSWWDGFIAQYINLKYLHKKLHIMMLEEQLKNRMFLNKAGAFSIQKESRGLIESLNYAADVLKSPVNLLVMYPQGQIQSMYIQSFVFEKGIERIRKASTAHQLLFYQVFVDYGSNKKPGMNIYLDDPGLSAEASVEEIRTAFQEIFEKNRLKQIQNI